MRLSNRHIHLVLHIDGEDLSITAPPPPPQARLDELLPTMQAIDHAAIDHAVRTTEAAGSKVSCTKGCSACCRAQPVPVTPPEAYALLLLLEALPETRRAVIEARFEERVARLHDTGLSETFLRPSPRLSADAVRANTLAYFQLGLACPFLEDDACSIYPQRPFACRQHLVTSSPALCADPFTHRADVVPMPLHAATALLAVTEHALATPQRTIPLVLALRYARRHRDVLARRFDAQPLFQLWLQRLAMPAKT